MPMIVKKNPLEVLLDGVQKPSCKFSVSIDELLPPCGRIRPGFARPNVVETLLEPGFCLSGPVTMPKTRHVPGRGHGPP